MTTLWSSRQPTASTDKRKPSEPSKPASDDSHDTSENDLVTQTDLNQKSVVYTSLSSTYSTEPYTNSAKRISEHK